MNGVAGSVAEGAYGRSEEGWTAQEADDPYYKFIEDGECVIRKGREVLWDLQSDAGESRKGSLWANKTEVEGLSYSRDSRRFVIKKDSYCG